MVANINFCRTIKDFALLGHDRIGSLKIATNSHNIHPSESMLLLHCCVCLVGNIQM